MQNLLCTLSIAAVVAGCSHADEGRATDWTALSLQGKTLDLVDDAKVETYSFSGQGLVAVTIGTKGGPVAAPLYYWRVKDNSLIISELPNEKGVEELGTPKIQGDLVSAKRGTGSKAQYRLSKSRA